jgi:hypothetical protein
MTMMMVMMVMMILPHDCPVSLISVIWSVC